MTDFLSSLVERSFGTVATVRPRVASLFEPARSTGVSSANLSEPGPGPSSRRVAEEPNANVMPAEPRATLTSDESAARRERPARTRSESPAASLVPRSEFSVPPLIGASDPLSLPHPVHEWTTPEGIAQPMPDYRHLPAARDNGQHEDIARSTTSPVRASQDAGQSDDAVAAPVASMAVPRVADVEPRRLLIPSRLDAEIASDLQRSVSAWSSQRRERAEGSERATMDQAARPERNVHVTIGRIEVRATGVQKSPVREPAAPPVMGLDEYLRRQSQRGAR
jgi:hypothetical protein